MLSKNDFSHPGAQDGFKIRRQYATLIQKSFHPGSIIAYSYSTDFSRRLFRQHRPEAVLIGMTKREVMKATGWQQHSLRGFLAGMVAKSLS